ncbi:MAG: hypothetical protein A3A86_04120 [Elusimicrobia bacterium RIFCSPLOWO2_01_FULL_60_11]|nr:MAG: hypothetical protein A3A86_04120 [Elusimicrobia bacterium RIFCSPLOWO2_01_FULL_60_11]
MIKRFSQVARYDRLHTFVSYLESLRQAGEDPAGSDISQDDNAVRVLTVHAAKGLEFETVFLAGLEQERFPARNMPERIELPDDLVRDILPSGDYHLQEERRLFYVGMTRAKTELILTSARNLGGRKSWKPSQFVLEALDRPLADEKTLKTSPLDSLKAFQNHPQPLETNEPERETVLSATAVEDYLRCPLRYKFSRVVKIPVLMHHTAVFGTAVHESLKAYNAARRDEKTFSMKQLLGIFENSWKSEGFISREHEDRRYQEGLDMLRAHFKREQKSKSRPSFVEQGFKMNAAGARIIGRWDRIDLGKESSVIDYKTSDVKDEKAAQAKAKDSRQLGLYAMAFEKKFGKLPDKLTLHFVKFGIEGTVRPTPRWMEGMLEDAEKAVRGVSQGNYDPNPSYGCRTCPYEKICPALRKG